MQHGEEEALAIGHAFARIGLLGNPSDGYGGKVIGVPIRNFGVSLTIRPAASVTISSGGMDFCAADLEAALSGTLPPDVVGLERLVLAALRRFAAPNFGTKGQPPDDEALAGGSPMIGTARHRGLALECKTTIPRQVGMAGSSATIIATLRALGRLFHVSIEPFDMAEMALATEVEDLGIAAGPMDRVIQSYEQVMLMDFSGTRTESSYETFAAELLPPLLLAWTPSTGRSSGVTHSDLRARWERGDRDVVHAMAELCNVVDAGVAALRSGDVEAFSDAVDRNYELRLSVTDVTEIDARLVQLAQDHGAAAKLCGSGGGVVVVPRRDTDVAALEASFTRAGFLTCRPLVS